MPRRNMQKDCGSYCDVVLRAWRHAWSGQPIRVQEWFLTSCSDPQEKKCILHTFSKDDNFSMVAFCRWTNKYRILLRMRNGVLEQWPLFEVETWSHGQQHRHTGMMFGCITIRCFAEEIELAKSWLELFSSSTPWKWIVWNAKKTNRLHFYWLFSN